MVRDHHEIKYNYHTFSFNFRMLNVDGCSSAACNTNMTSFHSKRPATIIFLPVIIHNLPEVVTDVEFLSIISDNNIIILLGSFREKFVNDCLHKPSSISHSISQKDSKID